jgi:hypothetical protein
VPGSVCGALERGWLRKSVLARASHATGEPEMQAGADTESRTSLQIAGQVEAIDAVLLELGETTTLRGARLDVELADSLMHVDVVAGDFAGDSDRQLQSVAIACVAELLDDAAQTHEVSWHLQADGKHLLIGAIGRDQLAVFVDAAARHGMALGSVQPDFCVQWNRHADALEPGSAVFAVASGREAMVACVAHGAVAAISSGAWLDRQHLAGGPPARVKTLMCGLGLEPSVTASLLDARVDRLLASVGLDAAAQSAFVLVAPQVSEGSVSSRWTVLDREAGVS